MLSIFKINLFNLKFYINVTVIIFYNNQITKFKLIYLIARAQATV